MANDRTTGLVEAEPEPHAPGSTSKAPDGGANPAPRRSRSDGRSRSEGRARRIAGLQAAVAVLAILGQMALTLALVGMTAERDRTSDDLAQARVGQALGRRLAAVRARALEVRTAERDQASLALSQTLGELEGARGAIVDAEGRLYSQGTFIDTLQVCLGGVNQALNAAAVDDRASTVNALSSVEEACRTAEAATGASDDPAFLFDFADPFVLRVGAEYFAYSTNGGGGNVQLIRAENLGQWRWVGNALPALPPWAAPNRTWAPAVLTRGSGYVLYYTALHVESGRPCISRAI
ncbi:hypothetical protein BH18ACT4_BH18ACT4_13090 [soil metagenome]